ncbi:MAG: chemotaxis protein CheB [Candidatus Velthaea sp.]
MLAPLPRTFPASIVVAQHLDPRVPSHLPAILSKRTALEVISVDGRERLNRGTIYVVPDDRNVEISDGSVAVHRDANARPKPSIDLPFATAAAVYGERLIAVILTGLGSGRRAPRRSSTTAAR